MINFKLVFIVTVLLASSSVRSQDFDIFTLSQSWAQTSCWTLNKLWSTAATATCSPCKSPSGPTSWTIHGLWPSNRQGKHPSNCNTKPKFNAKLVNNLRGQLEEKWPSYNLKMSFEAFWGYEWKKHGTCGLDVASTSTVPKYFSQALKTLDSNNIGNVLQQSGIVPGNKYNFADVVRAIENTLRVNVYVKCAVNTVSKEQYLNEVSVCYDKSFQLTDCNNGKTTSNCNAKKQVVYPVNLKSC